MAGPTRQISAALLAWLLAGLFGQCWTLRLAVIPEPSSAGSRQPGGHDLADLAGSLRGRGHSVTTFGQNFAEVVLAEQLGKGDSALFDAILAQGSSLHRTVLHLLSLL